MCIRDSSKSAAIWRLTSTCEHSVAVVFSLNEKIRYFQRRNFPFLRHSPKNPLPDNSLARTFIGEDNTWSDPIDIPADVWLKNGSGGRLLEQVYIQENGYRITMLTIP